jgi:acetyltransferase-like isoleucine patch superfamily enzyme
MKPTRYTLKIRWWILRDRILKLMERQYWHGRIHAHTSSRVSIAARINGGENIWLGANVRIFRDAILNCTSSPFSFSGNPFIGEHGCIQIGEKTSIRSFACLYTYGGSITIGKECTVNPFVVIYGHGGVLIGDDVHIATHTVIISANHNFEQLDIPISSQEETKQGVHIGSDVWIGSGVRILDGVSIGKGSVIASGAVVSRDIPELAVAMGVPARVISRRQQI